MNLKWLRISFGIVISLAMVLAFFPATTAHAGFVSEEEPAHNTVLYGQTGGHSTYIYGGSGTGATTFHRKSYFPMVGRYVIFPGRAFKLQLFYDMNGCFCKEKNDCRDYTGDKCFP
jgi:hypothetical protein